MTTTNQREFTLDDGLYELLDELEPVDRAEWRHGHRSAYVFERDGKHWQVWINVHHEEGWELESGQTFRATEVEPYEVTVTKWRPVHVPRTSESHEKGNG